MIHDAAPDADKHHDVTCYSRSRCQRISCHTQETHASTNRPRTLSTRKCTNKDVGLDPRTPSRPPPTFSEHMSRATSQPAGSSRSPSTHRSSPSSRTPLTDSDGTRKGAPDDDDDKSNPVQSSSARISPASHSARYVSTRACKIYETRIRAEQSLSPDRTQRAQRGNNELQQLLHPRVSGERTLQPRQFF